MASLTITLSNTSSVTYTLPADDQQTAQRVTQQIAVMGGIWADNGNWYPVNAILQVSINL